MNTNGEDGLSQPHSEIQTSTGARDALLAYITDGVFLYDREFQFIYANEAGARFARRAPSELIGRKIADLFPGFVETEFFRVFEWVMTSRQPGRAMDKYTFDGGDTLWFETHVYPVPEGILSIVTEVTDKVKREEEHSRIQSQILQSQKLESLGVLAGGVAHDFNNLLMSILGYASLALGDLPASSPAHESIQQVELAAQRAADLCKQMLAYSGRGHFVVHPVDLSSMVADMDHLLSLATSKSATLKYNLAPNLPLVDADPGQLRQVLMNLVTNASDAIGDRSGLIGIATGVMECDNAYLQDLFIDEVLPSGRYVYLEVSDNGVGMDKNTTRRIFEPFFSTKFTGRGLGLAAVLGIVRGHNGTVKVYSEPGKGTTMKVLLPVHDSSRHFEDGALAKKDAWRGTGTILVVDDETTVRTVTRAALQRAGFSVLEACDGEEALQLLEAHLSEIRLVLLDVTMPRMGGEEAYRRIRQLSRTIPVVLSSGYNEQDATGQFNGKGLSGFIQKPYRPSDLIVRIRELLNE
ncbi:MAG: response regulator [Candidatus Hydrogenedentes bacterium]|nr:response regulator [Candidatus Hydrogenedentota bacterium]